MATIIRVGGVPSEGNATPADVVAGKTFSNDSDTGLTGTLVPASYYEGATPHIINQHIWIDSSTYSYSFQAPAFGTYILAFCVFGAYTEDKKGMSFTATMACTKNGANFEGGGIATSTIQNSGRSGYLITFQTVANAGDTIAFWCNPGINYWNGQLFHAIGYYK